MNTRRSSGNALPEPWHTMCRTVKSTVMCEEKYQLHLHMGRVISMWLLPGTRPTKDKSHDILQIPWHAMTLVFRPTKQISWHSASNAMTLISWHWGADILTCDYLISSVPLFRHLQIMAPRDVIAVEKERWTKRTDSEGVLLIAVDFSDNATLFFFIIYSGWKLWASKRDQFSVIFVHRRCCSGPVCN